MALPQNQYEMQYQMHQDILSFQTQVNGYLSYRHGNLCSLAAKMHTCMQHAQSSCAKPDVTSAMVILIKMLR